MPESAIIACMAEGRVRRSTIHMIEEAILKNRIQNGNTRDRISWETNYDGDLPYIVCKGREKKKKQCLFCPFFGKEWPLWTNCQTILYRTHCAGHSYEMENEALKMDSSPQRSRIIRTFAANYPYYGRFSIPEDRLPRIQHRNGTDQKAKQRTSQHRDSLHQYDDGAHPCRHSSLLRSYGQ